MPECAVRAAMAGSYVGRGGEAGMAEARLMVPERLGLGERTAFVEVYDRFGDLVFDFCRFGLSDEAAELATGTTFELLACGRLPGLDDPTRLKPWLLVLAQGGLRRWPGRGDLRAAVPTRGWCGCVSGSMRRLLRWWWREEPAQRAPSWDGSSPCGRGWCPRRCASGFCATLAGVGCVVDAEPRLTLARSWWRCHPRPLPRRCAGGS